MNARQALDYIGSHADAKFVLAKILDGQLQPRQGFIDFTLCRDEVGNLGMMGQDVVEEFEAIDEPLPRVHWHMSIACNRTVVEFIEDIREGLEALAIRQEHERHEQALDASLS